MRSISDNMDTFLPAHLVSLLSQGQVSVPRLAGDLGIHPGTIGSLMKLARNTRLASKRSGKDAGGVIVDLINAFTPKGLNHKSPGSRQRCLGYQSKQDVVTPKGLNKRVAPYSTPSGYANRRPLFT